MAKKVIYDSILGELREADVNTGGSGIADEQIAEHNRSETAHTALFEGKADKEHEHDFADLTDESGILTNIGGAKWIDL